MRKLKNFGFLLFPDLEELDLVGPWEIFNGWRAKFGEPEHCLTVSETGGVVQCRKGLRIVSDFDFENCPPLDALLVPGGHGRKAATENENLLNFVRTQAARAEAVLSVCTGSFILQSAGLLENRRAATYWSAVDELRQTGNIEVVEERFVRDGKFWSSAGVSAGIDLALAFIAERAGEETAGKVQLGAEYYPNGKIYGTAHLETGAPKYLRG
jgi:transcriptional regulator GlxA family with amidase domain